MEPEQIRDALLRRYAAVSVQPTGQFPYHVGRDSAVRLNYRLDLMDRITSDVVNRFVGVGNPFAMGEPQPDWNVVNIGCGCGLDTHMAALIVGPTGRVRGVDPSREMLAVARSGLEASGLTQVELIEGRAEALPIESG